MSRVAMVFLFSCLCNFMLVASHSNETECANADESIHGNALLASRQQIKKVQVKRSPCKCKEIWSYPPYGQRPEPGDCKLSNVKGCPNKPEGIYHPTGESCGGSDAPWCLVEESPCEGEANAGDEYFVCQRTCTRSDECPSGEQCSNGLCQDLSCTPWKGCPTGNHVCAGGPNFRRPYECVACANGLSGFVWRNPLEQGLCKPGHKGVCCEKCDVESEKKQVISKHGDTIIPWGYQCKVGYGFKGWYHNEKIGGCCEACTVPTWGSCDGNSCCVAGSVCDRGLCSPCEVDNCASCLGGLTGSCYQCEQGYSPILDKDRLSVKCEACPDDPNCKTRDGFLCCSECNDGFVYAGRAGVCKKCVSGLVAPCPQGYVAEVESEGGCCMPDNYISESFVRKCNTAAPFRKYLFRDEIVAACDEDSNCLGYYSHRLGGYYMLVPGRATFRHKHQVFVENTYKKKAGKPRPSGGIKVKIVAEKSQKKLEDISVPAPRDGADATCATTWLYGTRPCKFPFKNGNKTYDSCGYLEPGSLMCYVEPTLSQARLQELDKKGDHWLLGMNEADQLEYARGGPFGICSDACPVNPTELDSP